MFGRLGPFELIIILVIILMILGPNRLIGAGKALGRTISEFRREARDKDQEDSKKDQSS